MSKTRNTKQKELIIKEIQTINQIFSVEDLYKKIRKKDPKIGIATIYRTLKNLRSKHRLHSYICNRKIIYSREEKIHCHFICEKCKKSKHINLKKLDFIKNNIEGKICHLQIDITGICKNCSS